MADSLGQVRSDIVTCVRCPRLVDYRQRIAQQKKKEYRSEVYWGRPVPGFGDPGARLVVVGLAPAAHGANRTGRVFTGDRSAGFLVRAFYDAGFANQTTSTHRNDGLRYTDLYLSAAVRCAPPENRPSPEERWNCRPYLVRELRLLDRARAYLALGGFAWDALRDAALELFGPPKVTTAFAHGACAPLGASRPILWGSYHPSPQNTNTGRLTSVMLVDLLRQIRASFH